MFVLLHLFDLYIIYVFANICLHDSFLLHYLILSDSICFAKCHHYATPIFCTSICSIEDKKVFLKGNGCMFSFGVLPSVCTFTYNI